MRRILNQNLAQLLMQLRFTPQAKRRKQLDAAEKLLRIVKDDHEYPIEFVWFRITGFHPKQLQQNELIRGSALKEDLHSFIARLSAQLAQPVSEEKEKVYTIEELAGSFGVSTKTISRWRRRGLVARTFVFEDGRKRLGFVHSTVDRFVKENPDLVARARTFTRLTDQQRRQIVKRAGRLLAKGRMSRHRVIEQIARQTGRSHETIRCVLLKHKGPGSASEALESREGPITPTQAAEMYRLFKQGCGVRELMKRFNRSKSSVYRIINRRRAKALLAQKIEFVASDEFLKPDAERKILGKPLGALGTTRPDSVEELRLSGDSLSQYLEALKNKPILNRDQEVELFRRYNYLKYLACVTRAGMRAAQASSSQIRKIEDLLAQAEKIKNLIIEANLRLVVTVANKHLTRGTNLADLISEGNLSLMHAVEKFDYNRGFRFGTFASWVIAKDYARKIPAEAARLDKPTRASMKDVQKDFRTTATADVLVVERARRSLTNVISDNLNEREQYVILNNFGLVGSGVKKQRKTLKQIGQELGLTKERVRQIELVALQKLKQTLSIEEFELLTG